MEIKFNRWLPTVFLYALIGLFSILIMANLYLGINKAVTHNPAPHVFGLAPLVVLSGSMEPAIYPGDMVVIWKKRTKEYKVGEIVSYLEGNVIYTHRIIGMEEDRFILKGDNNNIADDKVRSEQFIGRVLLTLPKFGLVVLFLKKPAGMVFATIMLLICFWVVDYLKVRKRKSAGRSLKG